MIGIDQKPPAEYQKLYDLFEHFREKVEPLNPDSKEDMDFLKSRLDSGRWGFDPKVRPLAFTEIDRLGDVVMGPVYTSEEYPWPVSDGAPMAPLIQLSLNNVRNLSGVVLGDGLFQAWMPKDGMPWKDEFYFRVIPSESARTELLTDVPTFEYDHEYFQPVDWALDEQHRHMNDDGLCYQIVGWRKIFTSQISIEGFKHFKGQIPKIFLDEESNNILKAFDTILKNHLSEWSPSSNHLLGTFDIIQYSWDERPLPLFCFQGEGELGANWGDGSAQLFYHFMPDGTTKFSFDWSCY